MERQDVYEFITKCRSLIVKELQKEIIDYMYEQNVLTQAEYSNIVSYASREHQIISILDILPSKSKEGFALFVTYIRNWYGWIIEHYEHLYQDSDDSSDNIRNALQEGEVPPLPLWHVPRKEEFATLCNDLHQIERGQFVVVYGIGGCGKSTLVAEVLHQSRSLVIDKFKGKVFWITVGRESVASELTVMQEFGARLFTARGYNGPALPLDVPSAKHFIKERLNLQEFENCLLILDDVSSSKFIECFNIGYCVLVTTDNKDIMNTTRNHVKLIKLSEGFTEAESLQLFNKNLENQDSDKRLPSQAQLIHSLCKGFPLTISLIASQLAEHKEEVLLNYDRWDEYVFQLKNKDIRAAIGWGTEKETQESFINNLFSRRWDKYRQDQINFLYKALQMSIANLGEELRNLYQDFALFMDDVNIKSEVLCTLWGLNTKQVSDIMLEFEKKCLVIKTWNSHISSYVYCVHDLLLDYLKRELSEMEKKELHVKLIKSYRNKFGYEVINFPKNDNYIFLYLGYHLKEAGYWEEFPNIYLDLRFIEVKVLIHGTADLLFDFRKYKEYICNNEENAQKYEEFYCFISNIGICRTLSASDIIQFGLSEPKNGFIYQLSQTLAQTSDRQYFEFITDTPKENIPPYVLPCREKVTKAIFHVNGNVIIANLAGVIKLFDSTLHKSIVTFKGHRDKVTHLQLSKNLIYFLSGSKDSTVRVWYLNNVCGDGLEKPRTPSPQLVQSEWKDPWEKQRYSGESEVAILAKHTMPITDAQFSNNGMMIVTSAQDKQVIIWKFALEKNKSGHHMIFSQCGCEVIRSFEIVESCRFTEDDGLILCATKKGVITIYETVKGHFVSTVTTEYDIKSMVVLPETPNILVLILGERYYWVVEISKSTMSSCKLQNNQKYSTLERKKHDNCLIAAVSGDSKYVAIATSSYSIIIREIKSGKEVAKFHETNGKISGLCWSLNNSQILSSYENHILKTWNVKAISAMNDVIKLKHTVFDASWIPFHSNDDDDDRLLVTAILDNKNNINIFYDLRSNKIITQKPSENDIICQICVCPADGYVIYACETGSVYLVVLDKWTIFELFNVQCIRVCKMKLYYHQGIVVVLLVEKTPNKYSLVSWIKDENEVEEITGNKVIYEEECDLICDFCLDLSDGSLYVVKINHQCNIYNYKTASLRNLEAPETTEELNGVKFVDFALNFKLIASITEKQIILSNLETNTRLTWSFDDLQPSNCKFSFDAKYLAVGFEWGLVKIYNTVDQSVMEISDKFSNLNDMVWSPKDYRLLLVLDREIALYQADSNDKPISVLYLSVDKVVCNHSFSKIVTVDSSGHFHVLKHPL